MRFALVAVMHNTAMIAIRYSLLFTLIGLFTQQKCLKGSKRNKNGESCRGVGIIAYAESVQLGSLLDL